MPALFGGSIGNLVLSLILSSWVIHACVVRSESLRLRELELGEAARAVGVLRLRIAPRHLLPDTLGLSTMVGAFELAKVVILKAALRFVGIGLPRPQVSWGTMLADGRGCLSDAWWNAMLRRVAIAVVVLGVNMVGDRARDLLSPRRRADSADNHFQENNRT